MYHLNESVSLRDGNRIKFYFLNIMIINRYQHSFSLTELASKSNKFCVHTVSFNFCCCLLEHH